MSYGTHFRINNYTVDWPTALVREDLMPQNMFYSHKKDVVNFGVLCAIIHNLFLFLLADEAGASCDAGDLSMNSKCYRKLHNLGSWFTASVDCLSRGGSLAVFTDIGRPSDSSQLTDWLNTSGTDTTYWIGLIRSWQTTDEGVFFITFSLVTTNRLLYYGSRKAGLKTSVLKHSNTITLPNKVTVYQSLEII